MSELIVEKHEEKTQNIRTKAVRGTIFTLIGGISWGFSGACGQYLFSVKGIDPHWVTVVRMFIAGLILFSLVLFKHRKQMIGLFSNTKDRWTLIAFSLFGLISCQYTYLLAISYTNAGTATVLQYLGPLLIMIFVCGIDRRLPTKTEGIAIVLVCNRYLFIGYPWESQQPCHIYPRAFLGTDVRFRIDALYDHSGEDYWQMGEHRRYRLWNVNRWDNPAYIYSTLADSRFPGLAGVLGDVGYYRDRDGCVFYFVFTGGQ